ncbi:MAG: hypothetical protein KAT58_06490 [candidate division Zixibacteria bacterium]|nr:hypothetical protein [candidate division Zixibacteria bacterium]
MDDFNVWGINWIDGMLVTSRHLNQQQDFAVNLSRFNASALAIGYGIVKSVTGKSEPLEIKLQRDGDILHASVTRCIALLPNGTILNINSQFVRHQAVQISLDISNESRNRLSLYLYASPEKQFDFGDPQEGEELSRAPWRTAKPILSFGVSEQLPADCGIQIAELARVEDDYQFDTDFVPSFLTTACGSAVGDRMERLRSSLDRVQKAGLAVLAEANLKIKTDRTAAQEATLRGQFLQAESLLHQVAYNYNRIFDKIAGIGARELIDFFTGLARGFMQGFAIYPELRENVRTSTLSGDWGSLPGGSLLPELTDYQSRDYAFSRMTNFFDDTERILTLIHAVFNHYARGAEPELLDSIELGGFRFELQQHDSARYSYLNNRHHLIIEGIDPRSTKDVAIRISKRLLPQTYADSVIIYLGPNEVDDIAAASVARNPIQDERDDQYWIIQPNEFFPLKADRLVRLNVIIDGELDKQALESVGTDEVAVFSRSR